MHGVPAEDTEDEVHDEEGAQHHHRHEVDELPSVSLRVVDLKKTDVLGHLRQSGDLCNSHGAHTGKNLLFFYVWMRVGGGGDGGGIGDSISGNR
jgi:hypothetical protein